MFERALKEGLRFGCTECSQCCTGSPGYVWLSPKDIGGLARHFSIDQRSFLEKYCIKARVGDGFGYSLKEMKDNSCILLENKKCRAYDERPVQCRTYPFWDSILESEASWRNESTFCPGIDRGESHSPERITELMLESRGNSRDACSGPARDWSLDAS